LNPNGTEKWNISLSATLRLFADSDYSYSSPAMDPDGTIYTYTDTFDTVIACTDEFDTIKVCADNYDVVDESVNKVANLIHQFYLKQKLLSSLLFQRLLSHLPWLAQSIPQDNESQ
jgi:hypothetical protein